MTARRSLSPLFTWRSAICDSDLSPTQRHVALTLSLHMNERGGSCFPTHDQLKDETGLGRSTVITALKALEDAGWLNRQPGGGRRKGGNGQATEYAATVPLLDGSETVQETDKNRPAAGNNRPAAGHQDDMQGEEQGRNPLADAEASADTPPPIVKIDGRNLPLDALADACGIDPGSPRFIQVPVALNGRTHKTTGELLTPGITHLFWKEASRWANEHGEVERLLSLHGEPEQYAQALARGITRKAEVYRAKLNGATMSPSSLRDWWLDLERQPTGARQGGLTPDEIERFTG